MRLLLVGAFAYPHHQGSQVYFKEQAIALRAAGAEVELLTYASRADEGDGDGDDPNRWRALDGFIHHRGPEWAAPASVASGPSRAKPVADLALAHTLHDAIASSIDAGTNYDAIMTHNIEACVVAEVVRRLRHGRLPTPAIVYCVHTLLEHELSAYSNWLKSKEEFFSLKHRVKCVIDAFGRRVDRAAGARADGWIALTQTAEAVMRRASKRPGRVIAPPIPDPFVRLDELAPEEAALRHELPPGDFFLYSGNLDAYQALDQLDGIGMRLGHWAGEAGRTTPRIVIASHAPRDSSGGAADPDARQRPPQLPRGVEWRAVSSETEMLSLIASARATLVTRRAPGGFPIKLANSLACGTPPITFLGEEWGLTGGVDSRVVGRDATANDFANAIVDLAERPERAARLARGARALYERRHLPTLVARETLTLVEEIVAQRRG